MKRGFSLIEVAIIIAGGALLALVIGQLLINQLRIGERETRKTDVERSASLSIETVRAAIQSAKTVIAVRTFGGTPYSSSADTLILELPSIDSSGNLLKGKSDYIVFFRDSSDPTLLKITTEAAAGSARRSNTRIIATFVDSIEFRYNKANVGDADAIDVTLATSSLFKEETLRSSAHARVQLRNK